MMALVELERAVESESPPLLGRDSTLPHLVRRAQRRDEAAFSELYARFAAAVHGVALARLGPDLADDATQETFITAYRELEKLREPAAFGAWLLALARNRATDFLRARGRRRPHVPLDDSVAGRAAAEDELRARVLHHVRSLPEAYRETLVLRLVEGLTGPEIAAATGLEAGSVRVNLHRGMELLRPLLRKEGWGSE